MTITLALSPELEQRLLEGARREGVAADEYTLHLLDQHFPPKDRASDVVSLLQSWIDHGDSVEQKNTDDFLVRTLDEDRLSNRKLFPPELEGATW